MEIHKKGEGKTRAKMFYDGNNREKANLGQAEFMELKTMHENIQRDCEPFL